MNQRYFKGAERMMPILIFSQAISVYSIPCKLSWNLVSKTCHLVHVHQYFTFMLFKLKISDIYFCCWSLALVFPFPKNYPQSVLQFILVCVCWSSSCLHDAIALKVQKTSTVIQAFSTGMDLVHQGVFKFLSNKIKSLLNFLLS